MSDSPFGPEAKYDQFDKIPALATAHGTLMGLTFVVILPLGSLIIRLVKSKYGIWIHVACQMIGWVLMLAGLAKGIQLADIIDIFGKPHTVIGAIVVAALILQPVFGFIHHRVFKARQKRTLWTALHVWYGRMFLILGLINGGSGLALVKGTPVYSKAGAITYAVLAAISGIMMLALIPLVIKRKKMSAAERTKPEAEAQAEAIALS